MAVRVIPPDVLQLVMHVAKMKYIWLELMVACDLMCRRAEKPKPQLFSGKPKERDLLEQHAEGMRCGDEGRHGSSWQQGKRSSVDEAVSPGAAACQKHFHLRPSVPAEMKEKQRNVFILLALECPNANY